MLACIPSGMVPGHIRVLRSIITIIKTTSEVSDGVGHGDDGCGTQTGR